MARLFGFRLKNKRSGENSISNDSDDGCTLQFSPRFYRGFFFYTNNRVCKRKWTNNVIAKEPQATAAISTFTIRKPFIFLGGTQERNNFVLNFLFILLFSFQFSFFLWIKHGLFVLFSFAFISFSLIAHICFSFLENDYTVCIKRQTQTFFCLYKKLPLLLQLMSRICKLRTDVNREYSNSGR